MTVRHKSRKALVLCPQCGAWALPANMLYDQPKAGCIRRATKELGVMCKEQRILLLEMALRRAIIPDAFDGLRIKPGKLLDVLDAEAGAIRQVAALYGPIPADRMEKR